MKEHLSTGTDSFKEQPHGTMECLQCTNVQLPQDRPSHTPSELNCMVQHGITPITLLNLLVSHMNPLYLDNF